MLNLCKLPKRHYVCSCKQSNCGSPKKRNYSSAVTYVWPCLKESTEGGLFIFGAGTLPPLHDPSKARLEQPRDLISGRDRYGVDPEASGPSQPEVISSRRLRLEFLSIYSGFERGKPNNTLSHTPLKARR